MCSSEAPAPTKVLAPAYLFNAVTGQLLQSYQDDPSQQAGDMFGISVAIDGNNVVVGASEEGSSTIGAAYLFNVDTYTGDPVQTFQDPGQETDASFGARGRHLGE